MSNLIPEPRVDKNGVTNTKWVKQHLGSSSLAALPAPSLPPAVPAERSELVDELTNWMMSVEASPMFSNYGLSLERLEDKTLHKIKEAMLWNRRTSASRGSDINIIVLSGKDHVVREELLFLPQFDIDVDIAGVCAMVKGLHNIKAFAGDHLDELPDDKLLLARAFLHVTETILYRTDYHYTTNPPVDAEINGTGRYITDPLLVETITRNASEYEHMSDLIEKRGKADPEFLAQYFNNDTKALREGEL